MKRRLFVLLLFLCFGLVACGKVAEPGDYEQPRVLAEIIHGDFDHDGNDDYIQSYYIPVIDSLCIQLVDSVTGSIRWSDEISDVPGEQECFLRQIDNAYNDYIVRCSYSPDDDSLYCTKFYISESKEIEVEEWQSPLVLPEEANEARILDELADALPDISWVLMNSIGGISIEGPVVSGALDFYPVESVVDPEAVALLGDIADAKAQDTLDYFSNEPGGITGYEITELDHALSYVDNDGQQVELYYFSYVLFAEEPEKVEFAEAPRLTGNKLWSFGDKFIAVKLSEGRITEFAYIGVQLPVDPDNLSEMGRESIEFAMQPYLPNTPDNLYTLDIDHDGEPENVKLRPYEGHPFYPLSTDLWTLCVEDGDGSLIWSHKNLSTSHQGWNSYFAVNIDGLDYLVRFDPYMSNGLATYGLDVFHIEKGNELIKENRDCTFQIMPGEDLEITEEMAAYAEAVSSLAPRCTLLFSTLEGKVLIGPRAAAEDGIMSVDFGP